MSEVVELEGVVLWLLLVQPHPEVDCSLDLVIKGFIGLASY